MKKKNFLIPINKTKKNVINFFKSKNIYEVLKNQNNHKRPINQMVWSKTLAPDLNDLYRLYQFVYLNKRTTILEIGTGWSTFVLAHALQAVKNDNYETFNQLKLRRHNPFEIFTLDNSKKYLNISKKRILKLNKNKIAKVSYCHSDIFVDLYMGKFVSNYKNLPLCNPDFIYIDGPDPFMVKGKINNFNPGHGDLMPINADILKIEYYLIPGTIILLDGRTSNARFLRDHFKRKWIYKHDKKNDQNIFYLDEPPLGKVNQKQLMFYSSNN